MHKKTCHHRIYGLPCAVFDAMRWRASDRCEICGVRAEQVQKGPLYIDHDSRLGSGWDHVRGLVCAKCNANLRYVDNGYRRPTPAQLTYIQRAWFWEILPPERLDEPYFPPTPKDGGGSCEYWDSPAYRRRCAEGRIDAVTMKRYPPQEKPNGVSLFRCTTEARRKLAVS